MKSGKTANFSHFSEIPDRVEEITKNSQNFYIYTLNASTLFLWVQYEKQQQQQQQQQKIEFYGWRKAMKFTEIKFCDSKRNVLSAKIFENKVASNSWLNSLMRPMDLNHIIYCQTV